MPESRLQKLLAGRLIFLKLIYIKLYCFFKHSDNKLKEYKNKHCGERCFIVATGPSLTLNDLEILENEVTFSLNSCVKLFEKTRWRPTYYAIFDNNVYSKLKKEIDQAELKSVFYGDFFIKKLERNGINVKMNMETPVLSGAKSKFWNKRKELRKFSFDVDRYAYYGFSTVYILLQLAAFMGFKEIYLVGADCNYAKGKEYSSYTMYDNLKHPENITDNLIWDYKTAGDALEKKGIKIFNATRGGMLELFPRVSLEEVISSVR